jgi:hypothetical protein
MNEIIFLARNVSISWRKLSEDIWEECGYGPAINSPEHEITSLLQSMPALRKFIYYGTCNVTEILSEYCTKLTILNIPQIRLSADNLKIIIERLTEVREPVLRLSRSKRDYAILCEIMRYYARSRDIMRDYGRL